MLLCLTDISLYIYVCVKQFGMANMEIKKSEVNWGGQNKLYRRAFLNGVTSGLILLWINYGCCLCLGLCSVDCRIIDELWIEKNLEGSLRDLVGRV